MSENPIAGWYEDPTPGSEKLRYWDGDQWTEQYTDAPGEGTAAAQDTMQTADTVAQHIAQPVAQPVDQTPAEPVVAQPVMYQQPPQYNQQYGQPPLPYNQQYGQPSVSQPGKKNGFAVASLVLGIIGLLLAGILINVMAIIFGILGLRNPYLKGMAIAGLILGGVGAIWSIYLIAVILPTLSF